NACGQRAFEEPARVGQGPADGRQTFSRREARAESCPQKSGSEGQGPADGKRHGQTRAPTAHEARALSGYHESTPQDHACERFVAQGAARTSSESQTAQSEAGSPRDALADPAAAPEATRRTPAGRARTARRARRRRSAG